MASQLISASHSAGWELAISCHGISPWWRCDGENPAHDLPLTIYKIVIKAALPFYELFTDLKGLHFGLWQIMLY